METKENKQKCKDCINFDVTTGWSGDDDGCCKRLGSNKLLIFDAKQNQFISFTRDSNPQSVHVGKNFGCVLFDSKLGETDSEQ